MKKRYLIIIPARSGSKGIKDKNIVDVAGKPLIQYTLDSVKGLIEEGYASKVILSTDSQRIADLAKGTDVEVPFLRPEEISGDRSSSASFVMHALEFFKNESLNFDAVVILQPTSPLRTKEDIKKAIEMFDDGYESSLISCYKDERLLKTILYNVVDGKAIAFTEDHNKGIRRQDADSVYVRNGAIYIVSSSYVGRESRIISDKPLAYLMPKERSLNIDGEDDLNNLKNIVRR